MRARRYEDLQAKMKNAALARTMEQEERGERFTLLQAPTPPQKLYSPNRLGIILLGMVSGSGHGVWMRDGGGCRGSDSARHSGPAGDHRH